MIPILKEKLRLIKDPIHGSIPYTTLEGYILSSVTFNRLHYIHQNSLAYFVYPTNRTSRFAHSIGVMHLASNMFRFSLLNARRGDLNAFFKTLKEEINKIVERVRINIQKGIYNVKGEEISKLEKSTRSYNISTLKEVLLQDRALQVFAPPNLTQQEDRLVYYITIQAIRIAGLLHDLGHLPFSHISEYILLKLLDDYEKIKDEKDREQISQVEKSDAYKILERYQKRKGKIHELLRSDVLKFIFYEEIPERLSFDLDRRTKEYWRYLFSVFLQGEITNELLGLEDSEFLALGSLRQIISEELDADRLDFIIRDLKISGLLEGAGDIDRIVKFFTLVYENDQFYFVPAIQALNNIEQIFDNRFTLYRYIAFHHRVALYNCLLERISKNLIDKVKFNNIKRGIKAGTDILQLIRVCEEERKEERKMKMYVFSQIDDYWLLNLMKEKYFELLGSLERDEEILEFFLKELFTRSKQLISLWKRDYEFRDFIYEIFSDKNFISELKAEVENYLQNTPKKIEEVETLHELLQSLPQKGGDISSSVDIFNFITSYRKTPEHFIEHIETEMQKSFNNQKIICAYVRGIDIGIRDLRIWDPEKQVLRKFIEVSQVYNYLIEKEKGTVKFYLYFPRNLERGKIYEELQRVFKECFKVELKNLLSCSIKIGR